MAKIMIGHKPDLTKDKLGEIFKAHFKGKYEVYTTKIKIDADLVVKKANFSAAGVKLIQKKEKTLIDFYKCSPSGFVDVIPILGPLITILFASEDVVKDVQKLINTAPEFK